MSHLRRSCEQLCVLFLSLLLSLGCNLTAAPTTPTATTAPTAAATLTATNSPTATAIATATATPTPEGWISVSKGGFALIAPSPWEISQQSSNDVVVINPQSMTLLYATSFSNDEPLSFEELFTLYETELFGQPVSQRGEAHEIALEGGLIAQAKMINFNTTDGEVGSYVMVAQQGKRAYFVVFIGQSKTIETSQADLEKIMRSLHTFVPTPYGLDHNQTLVQLGRDPEIIDLDPATSSSSAADYVGLLYNGLVRLTASMQVVPELAESWQVSPDGLTYTFTLRQGMRFSSGKPITAQDVKDSWERTCDPALQSPTARTYLGDIVGVNDKLDGKATQISGLKVMDERTLQITLDGPKPYFIAKLTYPTAFVMNTQAAQGEQKDWVFKADSSGPYRIQKYEPEEGIVFERNPNYFNPPAIPYLVFDFNPGGSPLSLYEEGLLDLLPLSTSDAALVSKPEHPLHDQLQTGVTLCTTLLQFNNQRPPMDDPNVRRAFALAMDPADINQRIFEDQLLVANSILPPAMPGFNSSLSAPRFNAAAAQKALADSRYAGNLPPIVLSISGYPGQVSDAVNAMVSSWNSVLGVQVTIESVDPSRYTEEVRKNPGHMVYYSWCADYPDPQNFLDVLYHGQSEFNAAGYNNDAVNRLLEQARTESDPVKRLQIYQQAEQLLIDDTATLPMFHSKQFMLVNPRLRGYVLSPIHTAYILDVSLEP